MLTRTFERNRSVLSTTWLSGIESLKFSMAFPRGTDVQETDSERPRGAAWTSLEH